MTDPRNVFFSKWLLGAAVCATALCAQAAGEATPQAADKTAPATQREDKPGAAPAKAAPAEDPSTLIFSDTLHYDDIKKQSIFTGSVVMTRGLMTLHSDTLTMHENPDGSQFGTATANSGKIVTIRQERPETFEVIEGKGLRAEYDDKKSQFDLIGQAVVTRFVCGKPFDSIRGDRVRYNDKSGTYEATGGPNSAAAGGRVRSIAEPRAKSDAAAAACRQPSSPQKR